MTSKARQKGFLENSPPCGFIFFVERKMTREWHFCHYVVRQVMNKRLQLLGADVLILRRPVSCTSLFQSSPAYSGSGSPVTSGRTANRLPSCSLAPVAGRIDVTNSGSRSRPPNQHIVD